MPRPTFEKACAMYVHRFTMEHIPTWATRATSGGWYYAPQFSNDREWYDATMFPGEPGFPLPRTREVYCYTANQTWPLGQWLKKPYTGKEA